MTSIYPEIFITQDDYRRILSVLEQNRLQAEDLREELARATIVSDAQMPPDAVTMNSTVTFRDERSSREMKVTLVYPEHANAAEGKISVLAPIGSALLGLRVGQAIEWPIHGEARLLKVTSVDHSLERA
jgi:regulator of nucleoside diphosphate kinase